ncbi:MAG: acyltransferase [Pseudomonadota bacterium]
MRYESIRSLRGIAAALVVIYHACEYVRLHSSPASDLSFAFGAIGVDLFFVISGFVMMTAINPKNANSTGPQDAFYFFLKRLARIVPMYWLSTIFLYTIYLTFKSKFQNLIITPDKFIDSILFIPVISSSGNLSPVVNQGWTLHHELFFYLMVSTLIAINASRRAATLLPIALIFIYITITLSGASDNFIVMGSGMNFEFGMGCLLSIVSSRKLSLRQHIILGLAATAAVSAALLIDYSSYRTLARSLSWGAASVLVAWLAIINDKWFKGPVAALSGLLGDASYSIYLFHGISFSAGALILKKIEPQCSNASSIVYLTVFSFIGGYFVYRLIEKPCLHWLTKKINNLKYLNRLPYPRPK